MKDLPLDEAYRDAVRKMRLDCPSPERLRALAENQLPPRQRTDVLNHVMSCGSCRKDFDLLDAIHVAWRRDQRSRRRRRWVISLGAAAAVAGVSLGVAVWASSLSGPTAPVFRGTAAEAHLVAPSGTVEPGAQQFAWHPVDGAVRYEVRVSRSDGSVLASRSVTDTVTTFDADWTRRSGDLRWRVIAYLLDGSRIRSPYTIFTIR